MKFMQEERGSISVFLLMCLLPMILFEGAILDGVRLLSCRAEMVDAGKLAMDGALAGYNRDLKDAYGLYAITDTSQVEKDAERYFMRSIDPKSAGVEGAENTANYLQMSGSVKAGVMEGSELSNNKVFDDQVLQFMTRIADKNEDNLEYIYAGAKYLRGAYSVIRNKCDFDLKLKEYEEGTVTSTRTLRNFFENWKESVTLVTLSEDMREKAMQDVNEAEELLEVLETAEAEAEAAEEAESEEAEDEAPESEPAAAEKYTKEMQIKESELKGKFLHYGNLERVRFAKLNQSYTEINTEAAPVRPEDVTSGRGTYEEIMDECLEFLDEETDLYSSKYWIRKRIIQTGGYSQEGCTALYAYTMLSSWDNCQSSITGNSHFYYGKVPSRNNYSEVEYIIWGGSDGDENLSCCRRSFERYAIMWRIVENYFTTYDVTDTALSDAKILAGDSDLKVPFYQDMFLLAEGITAGYTQFIKGTVTVDSDPCYMYQGDHTWYKVGYSEFLVLLLYMHADRDLDTYRDRIRYVIEMNMQNAGYTDFSFETSYNMIWIDAKVQVSTLLLPEKTWEYKNVMALQ